MKFEDVTPLPRSAQTRYGFKGGGEKGRERERKKRRDRKENRNRKSLSPIIRLLMLSETKINRLHVSSPSAIQILRCLKFLEYLFTCPDKSRVRSGLNCIAVKVLNVLGFDGTRAFCLGAMRWLVLS
jgi:hypothetical protein